MAAMKAREQELREKQIKALLVKKEQEAAAVVKEQQRQEAKEKYQAKLDEWAMEERRRTSELCYPLSDWGSKSSVDASSHVGRSRFQADFARRLAAAREGETVLQKGDAGRHGFVE